MYDAPPRPAYPDSGPGAAGAEVGDLTLRLSVSLAELCRTWTVSAIASRASLQKDACNVPPRRSALHLQ